MLNGGKWKNEQISIWAEEKMELALLDLDPPSVKK